MILAGDDGHLYRFPAEAMADWRQPTAAAAAPKDDPSYTSPDGICYVIPRAEVQGYCLSDESTAAIRSQLGQHGESDVQGFSGPLSGCPPGYIQYVTGPNDYTCVSPAWNEFISTAPAISPLGFLR